MLWTVALLLWWFLGLLKCYFCLKITVKCGRLFTIFTKLDDCGIHVKEARYCELFLNFLIQFICVAFSLFVCHHYWHCLFLRHIFKANPLLVFLLREYKEAVCLCLLTERHLLWANQKLCSLDIFKYRWGCDLTVWMV